MPGEPRIDPITNRDTTQRVPRRQPTRHAPSGMRCANVTVPPGSARHLEARSSSRKNRSVKIPWLPLDEVNDGDEALMAPTRTLVSTEQKTLVWHYTRHHTLELILGSHTLQISNAADMNDSAELRLGEKIMRKELKRLPHGWMDDPFDDQDIERLRDFHFEYSGISFRGSAYVLSASRRGDDNAQWDRYADWDGFAIGLPCGVMIPVLGQPAMSPTRDYVEEFPFRWADRTTGRPEDSVPPRMVGREYSVSYVRKTMHLASGSRAPSSATGPRASMWHLSHK